MSFPATIRRFANIIEGYTDETSVQNGHWVYLVPGWIYGGTHQIHEDTLKECASCLASVDKCCCEECLQLIAEKKAYE